jgi:hypothetical protein
MAVNAVFNPGDPRGGDIDHQQDLSVGQRVMKFVKMSLGYAGKAQARP